MKQFLSNFPLRNSKFTLMLLLGFSSGLPYHLLGQTLQAWFTVDNASLMVIGWVGLLSQFFAFKFLWSPLFDHYRLPFGTRRRSWLLLLQSMLILIFIAIGFSSPSQHGLELFALAAFAAFLGASQDIVNDAMRTELLSPTERGFGSAVFIAGFRMAMLFSGGFALYLAAKLGWQFTYLFMALAYIPSIILIYLQKETDYQPSKNNILQSFTAPIKELCTRPHIFMFILLLIFYKTSDHALNLMLMPFLIRYMHFSLSEIGLAVQLCGFMGSLLGMFVGGYLLSRYSLVKMLLVFAFLQSLTIVFFIIMTYFSPQSLFLYFNITSEYFCNGLGTSAIVAFMMSACHRDYTATQFALFSSATYFTRLLLAPFAGLVVEKLGYVGYFWLTLAISLPAIGILIKLLSSKSHIPSLLDGEGI